MDENSGEIFSSLISSAKIFQGMSKRKLILQFSLLYIQNVFYYEK